METDKKADLIYYPAFDTLRAKKIQKNILKAQHILFNPCDIPCPPRDKTCPVEKEKLISIIKGNFNEIYHKKSGEWEHYIFTASLYRLILLL